MSEQLSPEEPHRIVKDPLVEQLKDEIKVSPRGQSAAAPEVLGSFRCQLSRSGYYAPVLYVPASPSPFASREAPDAVRSGDVRGETAEQR